MEQLKAEHGFKMDELKVQQDIAMIGQAGDQNAAEEREQMKLEDSREERAHKERIFAGEAAMTNLEASKGGGGSL
jgi:hypothetical protein